MYIYIYHNFNLILTIVMVFRDRGDDADPITWPIIDNANEGGCVFAETSRIADPALHRAPAIMS